MNKREKKVTYFAYLLTALSGVAIFVTKEFFEVMGAFGPERHPTLEWWKIIHYLLSPLLILVIGFLWSWHIKRGFIPKFKERKKTGLVVLFLSLGSILSGQFLLFNDIESLIDLNRYLHLGIGLSVTVLFLYHSLKKNAV